MATEDDFEKVYIDLPNHPSIGGEAMWARRLDNNQYELQNVPFHAYGLNFLDVVEAVSESPDKKPSIVKVVRASGHRTLRVVFLDDEVPRERRVPMLEELRVLGASIEGADYRLFSIDVRPDGDIDRIRDRLDSWTADGLLDYETCESRVEGSFDDFPAGNEGAG